MKYSPTLLAFAALLSIVYGVLFSRSYPLVEITGGIVALCVLLGIVTCLTLAAIWSAFTRSKPALPTDAAPPPPASTNSPAPPSSRASDDYS
jgi:uncharacterized ion transporter superfamily protein YfcC